MKINYFLSSNFKNINYVYVIAEACDNHFGDINKAFKMAFLAKRAGADAIKFQHHLVDEEMLKNVPKSSNFDISLYDFLKKNSLKLEDHLKIKRYCKKINIQYLCTPFSYKAAVELLKFIKVDCFKIGSGELTDLPSIEKIANLKKPMIISTGMSTSSEISRTYKLINKKVKLVIMNCLSEYPPDYRDLNLGYISVLKKKYPNNIIGHSDHTGDIFSSIAAYSMGARVIEKHVTLDKNFKGPDQKVSIDFSDLKILVRGLRNLENSFGAKKKIHSKEIPIRKWATRSVVSIADINKGEVFSLKNIWTKRPGIGIPASKYYKIIGKKSIKKIKKNKLIKPSDVQ
jgi:sialic acid synthase SpsE